MRSRRWAGLFCSTCEVVLFDLTSTYFEVDGTKALDSELQRNLRKHTTFSSEYGKSG